MLRLYITGSSINLENNNITVWDYLTYEPIAFYDLSIDSNKAKAKKELTTILNYSDEDYVRMLLDKGIKPNRFTKERIKDSEDWIKGAWLSLTNTILNYFNIKGENKPIENIKEILEGIKSNRKVEIKNKTTSLKAKSKKPLKPTRKALSTNIKPKEIVQDTPAKRIKKRLKKRIK